MFDFGPPPEKPKLWVPPKPAIIRPATDDVRKVNEGTFPFPVFGLHVTAAPVTITYNENNTDSATSSPHTFSAVSIGTAVSDRIVIVGITGTDVGVDVVDSMTIGGVSATQAVAAQNSIVMNAIWAAAVPTGTTADVVVTTGTGWNEMTMGCWSMTGASSVTAHDTSTDSTGTDYTASGFDVPASGGAVGIIIANAASRTFTSSGLDEDADFAGADSNSNSHQSKVFASAQTSLAAQFTVSSAATSQAAWASWGP